MDNQHLKQSYFFVSTERSCFFVIQISDRVNCSREDRILASLELHQTLEKLRSLQVDLDFLFKSVSKSFKSHQSSNLSLVYTVFIIIKEHNLLFFNLEKGFLFKTSHLLEGSSYFNS